MTTDLETQLKTKYDELASNKISYRDFATWFEQQTWPSTTETNRMFEAVEMTNAHIKSAGDDPDELSRGYLANIGDYLHGRTDVKPAVLPESGMSRDELRNEYTERKEEHKSEGQ